MSNFDKLIHDAKMKASFQKTDQNPSKKPRIVEKAGGSQMETETDGEEKGPLRSRVLAYIGKCHTSVHRLMMDGVDPNMEEVDLGKQIFNVVFNAYNAMRQSANGGSAKKKAIFDESGAKVMFENQSYQQPASAIYPIMTLCAKDFKLEYRKFEKDDQENWYSMASPYMTCLTLFGQRIREQRIGLSQVIIGKADEKPLVTPSQRFGIDPHLQILAEGLNIPPEKKSAIASALGPLTVLFELYKSKGFNKR
nr:TPA_asm: nucleocapsid [Cotesiavirus orthomyxi]